MRNMDAERTEQEAHGDGGLMDVREGGCRHVSGLCWTDVCSSGWNIPQVKDGEKQAAPGRQIAPSNPT